jgi:hypothetical protein
MATHNGTRRPQCGPPKTLRAYMLAGVNPLDGLDAATVRDLAADTIVHATIRSTRDRSRLSQLLQGASEADTAALAWGYELADDPQVRTWLTRLLPAGLVAEYQVEADINRRPFALTTDNQPHTCAACGQTTPGPHLTIIDRGGTVDPTTSPFPLHCCHTCIQGALAP